MLLTCTPKTSLLHLQLHVSKGYLKSAQAEAVAARLTLRGPMAHTNGSDLSPAHLKRVLNLHAHKRIRAHLRAATWEQRCLRVQQVVIAPLSWSIFVSCPTSDSSSFMDMLFWGARLLHLCDSSS